MSINTSGTENKDYATVGCTIKKKIPGQCEQELLTKAVRRKSNEKQSQQMGKAEREARSWSESAMTAGG